MNMETADAALTIIGIRRVSIGWGVSALVILFLLMDAVMKVLALPVVLEAGASTEENELPTGYEEIDKLLQHHVNVRGHG